MVWFCQIHQEIDTPKSISNKNNYHETIHQRIYISKYISKNISKYIKEKYIKELLQIVGANSTVSKTGLLSYNIWINCRFKYSLEQFS